MFSSFQKMTLPPELFHVLGNIFLKCLYYSTDYVTRVISVCVQSPWGEQCHCYWHWCTIMAFLISLCFYFLPIPSHLTVRICLYTKQVYVYPWLHYSWFQLPIVNHSLKLLRRKFQKEIAHALTYMTLWEVRRNFWLFCSNQERTWHFFI